MSASEKAPSVFHRQRVSRQRLRASGSLAADLYRGKKLVRRGRPKLQHPRNLLSLRLPPEVIANWKATGPGWQTGMAEVLEKSTPKSRRSFG